jgi:8-oxo-dGTP diphosphatase
MLWEFPGGKIDAGETPDECLVRECQEELGVTIETEHLLREVEYEYPEITVNIHFYICKLIDGGPTCIEHNDIQWHTLGEILELPLCPADNKMLYIAAEDIRYMISKEMYNNIVNENLKKIDEQKVDDCVDPDKATFYECVIDGLTIKLAQDGLCSLNRIKKHSNDVKSDYGCIRKDMFDCMVWPAYAMSINQMRRAKYEDRVDLLLLDIERLYDIVNSKTELTPLITAKIFEKCGLGRAYLFPNTFYWFRSFGSFNGFVESRKLQAFVDEQNSQFTAVKWTETDKFDDAYYNALLEKVKKHKKR